jgi:hypothetical protein
MPFPAQPGGGTLSAEHLKHNKRLHKVRQVVERFFGRMKKHLNIVGTIYRGDLELLPDIWLVAVWGRTCTSPGIP